MKVFIIKIALAGLFLIVFLLLNTSCSYLKKDSLSSSNFDIPSTFSVDGFSEYPLDYNKGWWHAFDSSELNELIIKSLSENPSLEQAWARINQANAIASKLGSTVYPNLNASLDVSDQSPKNPLLGSDNWSSGLVSNYELDFWGRLFSIRSSANLDALSAREAFETIAITLSAEVALRWNDLIACEMEINVLQQQLSANQTSLELIELRYKNSLATALDIFQQKQAVESVASLIPIAERKKQLASIELSSLLGTTKEYEIKTSSIPEVAPLPELGLPIDLLTRRPDVKLAIKNLQSADWLVNAAKADRLPSIRLTASYDSRSESASNLFNNWVTTLAGNLLMPVFDGKQRRSEQQRAEAFAYEKLGFYKETVLRAIEEVETALALENTQKKYIDKLSIQFNAAEKAYNEAINRYRNGAVEYTTVLFQLNTLQQLERSIISAQSNLLAYRIALYRSLGGNWMKKIKLEEENEKN